MHDYNKDLLSLICFKKSRSILLNSPKRKKRTVQGYFNFLRVPGHSYLNNR